VTTPNGALTAVSVPRSDAAVASSNRQNSVGTGVDERERSAERLLNTSLRHQYDPVVEIDWEAEPLPGAFWLPPYRSSLYGTDLWHAMTLEQQIELTKNEVASAASAGIWFETILMQMLIRHYYDQDPTSSHAQYALTEVADECRHSIMFGRLIARLGCPPYPASRRDQFLGRFLKTTATGAHMFAAILIAEEILDSFQREIMADDTLQPLIRTVARIHVVEEARHVKYARDELPRQVEGASRAGMAYSRLIIGRAANSIVARLVHPDLYRAVGIDPKVGRATAMQNPNFRATLRWAGQRATGYLGELGLIGGPGKLLWRHAGLL
jgi:P-aminobenzoate N-oxygenase AurF